MVYSQALKLPVWLGSNPGLESFEIVETDIPFDNPNGPAKTIDTIKVSINIGNNIFFII